MKKKIIMMLASASIASSSFAINVDFIGSGSAGVLASCLVDLDTKIDGSLASEAPYTMMSSTMSGGATGSASVTAVNLPGGMSVTFTQPTLVEWNSSLALCA